MLSLRSGGLAYNIHAIRPTVNIINRAYFLLLLQLIVIVIILTRSKHIHILVGYEVKNCISSEACRVTRSSTGHLTSVNI